MRMTPLWGADMVTDPLFFAGFNAAIVFVWGMSFKFVPTSWFGKPVTGGNDG